jgi:replicative DNA helicase
MNENELNMRLLAAEARVPQYWLRNGRLQDEDWSRLARVIQQIAEAPLWLSHTPMLGLKDLEREIRTLTDEYDLRIVAIDCLQPLVTACVEEGSASGVSEILWHLRRISLNLDVPVLLTSRVRHKPAHEIRRPEIVDLQDSEAVFEEADVLIVLHRPDAFDKEHPRAGEIDVNVAKHRNGPTATITAVFQGHYARILDISGEDWPPVVAKEGSDTGIREGFLERRPSEPKKNLSRPND